jgi:hypothetical protein
VVALKINFESEHTRREYLNTPRNDGWGAIAALNRAYDAIADSPITVNYNLADPA